MGICQWSSDFFVLILISKGICVFETFKGKQIKNCNLQKSKFIERFLKVLTVPFLLNSFAGEALASPQTSVGVRLSRIHFSPTDGGRRLTLLRDYGYYNHM